MSVYGYIRVSSKDQKEDRQQIALKEVGVERQNMGMNKKLNLSISILCIIETICCFTPFCLDEEYWKYKQSMAKLEI